MERLAKRDAEGEEKHTNAEKNPENALPTDRPCHKSANHGCGDGSDAVDGSNDGQSLGQRSAGIAVGGD